MKMKLINFNDNKVSEIEILMLDHLGHKRLKYKLDCEPIETQWLAS